MNNSPATESVNAVKVASPVANKYKQQHAILHEAFSALQAVIAYQDSKFPSNRAAMDRMVEDAYAKAKAFLSSNSDTISAANAKFAGQRCALRCWIQSLEYGAEANGYDLDAVSFDEWLACFVQNDTPQTALNSKFRPTP